ncbi:T9SS type A sorting domain-containing protein [Calditrichota bacterium]
MKKIIIILLFLTLSLSATIINVPANIDSIQGGINMAINGDTVLVQPGTYYENINFNGKNIVVGSLTLTTGDTSYISQTIIDANSRGSVVTFGGEDSSAVLCGFTITNGRSRIQGGGILCYNSMPTLAYLDISNNETHGFGPFFPYSYGGGIFLFNSHLTILNSLISNNDAGGYGGGIYCDSSCLVLNNVIIKEDSAKGGDSFGGYGGGIFLSNSNAEFNNVFIKGNDGDDGGGGILCINSNLDLLNVTISDNTGRNGGGIHCSRWDELQYIDSSKIYLSNVTISNNYATGSYGHGFGGGIFSGSHTRLNFDPINRCNIYINHANSSGSDLFSVTDTIISVIVDTFTVMNPTSSFAFPDSNFVFDILNAKVEQVSSDLYINPNGNDENSGLSPADPLKTITCALIKILADSLEPNTIYLANGVYSPSNSGEHYPLFMLSYVSLVGESEQDVILDAESTSHAISMYHDKGVAINNLSIKGGVTRESGAGIACYDYSTATISYVTITNNSCGYIGSGYLYNGSGIDCYDHSNVTLSHVTITKNSGIEFVGLDCRDYSRMTVINCTISGNYSGIHIANLSNIFMFNTICWNYEGPEIIGGSSTATVSYSNIKGGWPGVLNINADPMFVDTANGDYSLQAGSPCINAGTAFYQHCGDTLLYLNPWQYNGSAPDMGAYEFGPPLGISEEPTNPKVYTLKQNYPNPFNPSTTIEFSIPTTEFVTLKIYNLLGQEVTELVAKRLTTGNHKYTWDASAFASGVYYYKVEAGLYIQTKKLILLK